MASSNQGFKNHFVAFIGEFVGTFLFLFFAFGGTQTANQIAAQDAASGSGSTLTQLLFIALVFGFSLAVNVWVFFRISGGLFNPAVALALCIVGAVPPLRSLIVFIAQVVGAIAAAGAVRGLTPGYDVMFAVQLSPGVTNAQGFFLEMIFTAELKTKATFVAPVGIGLALFSAELFGVYWTGGSLNPARAFAPNVVIRSFPGYHWIYWIAPFMGALLAAFFYKMLKYLNYEQVNGDQDKSGDESQVDEKDDGASSTAMPSRRSHQGTRGSRSARHSHEYADESLNGHTEQPARARAPPTKDVRGASAVNTMPVIAMTPTRGLPARFPNGDPYIQDINAQNRTMRDYSERSRDRAYRRSRVD